MLEAFLVLEASPVPVELPHMAVMTVLRLKRWINWKLNKPHKYIEVLYAQFFSSYSLSSNNVILGLR